MELGRCRVTAVINTVLSFAASADSLCWKQRAQNNHKELVQLVNVP